mgnify:CR=1 FL=1
MRAGVSSTRSECMARHMADKLSHAQLRRLARVPQLNAAAVEEQGLEEFLHNAQALGDPRIVTVTSAVALGCAVVAP